MNRSIKMSCCVDVIDTIKLLFWMVCDPFLGLFRFLCPRSKKNIQDEIVLITGAAHGIGKEVAIRMSKLGAVLVLWDINQECENLASKLRSAECAVFSYKVDVTNEKEVVQVANRVKQEVGDVTILVNNAGVFSGQQFTNLPSHLVRRTFEVNSMSHFWVLQQFLPRMMELDRGHIVAIASIAGHEGAPFTTDYCASKHATVGLMDSLYMELQSLKKHIHITTINPILVTTGLVSNVKTRFPSLFPLLPVEKAANAIVNSILREDEVVFIPKRIGCFISLTRCFSLRTRFRIVKWAGHGFDPEVEQKPDSHDAEIV